jgi:hypothetical protein
MRWTAPPDKKGGELRRRFPAQESCDAFRHRPWARRVAGQPRRRSPTAIDADGNPGVPKLTRCHHASARMRSALSQRALADDRPLDSHPPQAPARVIRRSSALGDGGVSSPGQCGVLSVGRCWSSGRRFEGVGEAVGGVGQRPQRVRQPLITVVERSASAVKRLPELDPTLARKLGLRIGSLTVLARASRRGTGGQEGVEVRATDPHPPRADPHPRQRSIIDPVTTVCWLSRNSSATSATVRNSPRDSSGIR